MAREILLLKDWVIPHYDFIPRLDKPVLFYWLVAFSYKLFGVSEWSARLPSVVAALGCLFLTHRLARSLFGAWPALWSALILVTSVEFFALSRIVILDMSLTFFISLSLCCFLLSQIANNRGKKRALYLCMYAAMGAATLVKGPVGFILPGIVIFLYLLFSKKWVLVRQMALPQGASLFLLTAAPWYMLAESRSPGYLRYFLLEENILRFFASYSNRTGPWYYFLLVLAVGFLPWTVLIPTTIADSWKRPLNGERLFLILWIILPLVFFSLSASKLPHYVLPVYPPLAVLLGERVAANFNSPATAKTWVLSLPALTLFLLLVVSAVVVVWPHPLPHYVREHIQEAFPPISIALVCGLILTLSVLVLALWKGMWARQEYLFILSCIGFAVFILFTQPFVKAVSLKRSSKELAEKAARLIGSEDQIVLYHRYLSSLPFYLRVQRPILVVWSGKESKVLGSSYVAENRPEPATGYGKVLYTHEEFADLWKSPKRRLIIFIGEEDVEQLEQLLKEGLPKKLLEIGDLYLMTHG